MLLDVLSSPLRCCQNAICTVGILNVHVSAPYTCHVALPIEHVRDSLASDEWAGCDSSLYLYHGLLSDAVILSYMTALQHQTAVCICCVCILLSDILRIT